MDVAKLNQEILGVDLEYKNVYIDAENTRMIRAKLPDGYCDLVRTDMWNGYCSLVSRSFITGGIKMVMQ